MIAGKTHAKALFSWLLIAAVFVSSLTTAVLPLPVSAAEPVNVALGKTVTAKKAVISADEGLVGIDKATDGDLTTQFKSGETGAGTDEAPLDLDFTVDLDGEFTISSVRIIHGASVAKDFIIQYSNDNKAVDDSGKEWKDIDETRTTGHTATDTQEFTFTPVNAKFVRMWVTEAKDQWGFEFKEFEVYGEEVPVTKYTVTYDANGGSGTPPTEANKAAGAIFTAAAANSFTAPEGKMFKEWNTALDGSGTRYDAKAQVTMPERDLILYAIWQDDTWSIPDDTEKVGTLHMKGDADFDSDSVANSDSNQPRWLSYPGARFTFNPNPNHERPLRPNLQIDIGGYMGSDNGKYGQSVRWDDIVSVRLAPQGASYEDAASVKTTWYPYKHSFTAKYQSLDGVTLSGEDFFTDAKSTFMRIIRVEGAADKKMKLTGTIPGGMSGEWDAEKKVLVISRSDPKYYYALNFVSLSGSGLNASDIDTVPVITGSSWSLEIPIGTAGDNYYGISFGFAVDEKYGEGKSVAASRAVDAFNGGAAVALANTKRVFDDYLKKVPVPEKFGIPEDIPAFNVTPELHRRVYYTAWTFLLDQIMEMLPENIGMVYLQKGRLLKEPA